MGPCRTDTTGEKMSYGPCKNSSCSSFGKPHPNCKCYGEMAEGGDVHFCATDRVHQPGCQYFAEGGEPIPEGFKLEDVPDAEEPMAEEPLPAGFHLEGEIPTGFKLESEKYSTGPQMAATAAEGTAQGLMGPLATEAELGYSGLDHNQRHMAKTALRHVLPGGIGSLIGSGLDALSTQGISAQDLEGRRQENPDLFAATKGLSAVGSLFTGAGEAAAIAKAAEVATGSKILQTAIQGGLIQGGDEVSKWALGHDSPEDAAGAVMAMGASTLFGGLVGGVSNLASKAATASFQKMAEAKLGERSLNFLRGLSIAAQNADPEARALATAAAMKNGDVSGKAFKNGMTYFDTLIPLSTAGLGAMEGLRENGLEGAAKGFIAGGITGLISKKALSTVGAKVVAPALLKVLSSGKTVGMAEAVDHAMNMAAGSKVLKSTVENMFKSNPTILQQAIDVYGGKNLKNDFDTFIGKGGVTQSLQQNIYDQHATPEVEGYAEGGEVQKPKKPEGPVQPLLRPDDGVAIHYPAQNMVITAARGRISNYLGGLRPPPHPPKLPFDAAPDMKQQKKTYDRAMGIAMAPLSVMHEIQKGTVEPDHIKHLNAMYPELSSLLQKKVTEQVIKAQIDGKKPSYKIRQGLSMLLGAPLSSEMTPQSIQAAQSTFMKSSPDQQQGQQTAPKKGNTSILSKVDQSFLTGLQARQKRAQRE